MTRAKITRLPLRQSVVWIMRDGAAWLVVSGSHGWLHGDRQSARDDAAWLSENLSLPVRELT